MLSFTMLKHPRTLILKRSTSMTIYTSNKRKNTFAKIKHQQGSANSRFGTCWIRHELHGNKSIQKDLLSQYVEQGWIRGRISNNPARVGENYKPKYTKISKCTNCNKFFPQKRQNKTCSPECAKIRSLAGSNAKKNVNRRNQEMIMTGAIHPTYLYIKQHSTTGLKYFGKTCQDPYKYKGSGRHWMRHFGKHGPEYIKTIWVSEPFTDAEDISEFAIFFSEEFDIIASKDWANMTVENGLDGAEFGRIVSEETRMKMSKSNKGKPLSDETKRKISESHKGKTHSDESKLKMSIFWSGRPKSNETKNKLSESLKGKTHSIETRKKMSHSRKDKTPSDFTRLKISESLRKYHEDKKKVVKVKD